MLHLIRIYKLEFSNTPLICINISRFVLGSDLWCQKAKLFHQFLTLLYSKNFFLLGCFVFWSGQFYCWLTSNFIKRAFLRSHNYCIFILCIDNFFLSFWLFHSSHIKFFWYLIKLFQLLLKKWSWIILIFWITIYLVWLKKYMNLLWFCFDKFTLLNYSSDPTLKLRIAENLCYFPSI